MVGTAANLRTLRYETRSFVVTHVWSSKSSFQSIPVLSYILVTRSTCLCHSFNKCSDQLRNAKPMTHPLHNLHPLLPFSLFQYLFASSQRSVLILFPHDHRFRHLNGDMVRRRSASYNLAHRAIPFGYLAK